MAPSRLIIMLSLLLIQTGTCISQIIDVKKAAENAAVNRTNQAINTGINMGINSIFNAPGKIYRKIKENKQQQSNSNTYSTPSSQNDYPTSNNSNQNQNYSSTPVQNPTVNVTTIYGTDFNAGSTTLWSDNFQSTPTGKFPTTWITSSVGEVRTIEDASWLQFSTSGLFAPATFTTLPDNFKIQFDAIFNNETSPDAHYIFYLYSTKEKAVDFKETNYPGKGGIYFAFNVNAGEVDAESFQDGKVGLLDFHLVTDALKASATNKIQVGVQKDNTKISLYINGHEVFSSTNALTAGLTLDALKFGSFYMTRDDFMLISNVKVTTN